MHNSFKQIALVENNDREIFFCWTDAFFADHAYCSAYQAYLIRLPCSSYPTFQGDVRGIVQ